jgi:hypothetical protein
VSVERNAKVSVRFVCSPAGNWIHDLPNASEMFYPLNRSVRCLFSWVRFGWDSTQARPKYKSRALPLIIIEWQSDLRNFLLSHRETWWPQLPICGTPYTCTLASQQEAPRVSMLLCSIPDWGLGSVMLIASIFISPSLYLPRGWLPFHHRFCSHVSNSLRFLPYSLLFQCSSYTSSTGKSKYKCLLQNSALRMLFYYRSLYY